MKVAAFFDIDGTLARDSMLTQHFKRLVSYKIIDEDEWLYRIRPRYRRYDLRYGEYDDYLDEVTDVYKENLVGMHRAMIDFTADQIVEEYGDVVYKYTRDRIRYHQEKGHLVFFISGSPDFIIEKMAKKYGVTDFRATKYVTDSNDRFTSEVIPMWDSDSKSEVIDQFEKEYQLDLAKSFGYGDTNGDFSMLKKLGRATAINPSYRLYEMIQEDQELSERVNIVVERKDVIYRLKGDVSARKTLTFDSVELEESDLDRTSYDH